MHNFEYMHVKQKYRSEYLHIITIIINIVLHQFPKDSHLHVSRSHISLCPCSFSGPNFNFMVLTLLIGFLYLYTPTYTNASKLGWPIAIRFRYCVRCAQGHTIWKGKSCIHELIGQIHIWSYGRITINGCVHLHSIRICTNRHLAFAWSSNRCICVTVNRKLISMAALWTHASSQPVFSVSLCTSIRLSTNSH